MSRLVFPVAGVRRLTASSPTFPPDASEAGGERWSDFLVEYAVTPRSGSDVDIVAPSVAEIRILPSRDPPLLTVHPIDPGRWIHGVPGWLAPRGDLFAFSFPGLEDRTLQERILAAAAEDPIEQMHPGASFVEVQEMARNQAEIRLDLWADEEEELSGPPLRTADVIHRFSDAPDSLRIGAASLHLFETETDEAWTWNWFDIHDLFLRIQEADAFAPPQPRIRPRNLRDEPFRIAHPFGRTELEPTHRRLTGGVQNVDYLRPAREGIPFVPPEMQVLTRGGAMTVEAYEAPDEWTHEVSYDYAPGDRTIFEEPLPPPPGEPAELDPDDDDPARLFLRFGDLRVDWDRAVPGRPVDVRILADGAGPSFPVSRDPIWSVGQAVQRAEDAREALEDWLDWKEHGPLNVELVELALTIDAVIRNLDDDTRAEIVEDRDDLYPDLDRTISGFSFRMNVLRRRTRNVANALTRWVFQALAHRPEPARAEVVARALAVLAATEEGRSPLTNKFGGFLEPDGGSSIVEASLLASVWNDHRSLRPSLAAILSRILRIELERITRPTDASDASLERFRTGLRAVLAGDYGGPGFDDLDVEDATLQRGARSIPTFNLLYRVGSGTVRIDADASRRISMHQALTLGREIAGPFGSLALIPDAILFMLDGRSLLHAGSDPSELPSALAGFAGSAKNLAETADGIHSHRVFRGVSQTVKGISPVLSSISIGGILGDIENSYARGDETAAHFQTAALVGASVSAAAFLVSTGGVGAGVLAFVAVAQTAARIAATVLSSTELELDLKRSFFGPEYDRSHPDHPDADPDRLWHGRIPMQIAHFREYLYPLRDATFEAGETGVGQRYQRLIFRPTLWEPGSMVTVDVWDPWGSVVGDEFFIPPWAGDGEGPDEDVIPTGASTRWFDTRRGSCQVRRDAAGRLEVEFRFYRDTVTDVAWNVVSDGDATATITMTTAGRRILEAVRTSMEAGTLEAMARAIREEVALEYSQAVRTVIEKS